MISRVLQVVFALALAVFLSACATSKLEATTDYDTRYDFAQVKRIAILPVDRTRVSSIAVSDLQVDRINEAITAELQRKGFEVVSDGSAADLYLKWHLVTEERTDVRTYNSMSYYTCWRCGPSVSDISVRQYTQGTLIIDMIDPNQDRSVWRSVIHSELKSQPDAEKAAERRRKAAEAALAQFPPTQPPQQ